MNFDLNINNYSRDELIQMFELPSNFDINVVEFKETKLRDNIFNNKNINKDTQMNTLNFLSKAKNIILNNTNQPNTLPQNPLQQMKQEIYNSNYELKSIALENPTEHDVQVRENKPYLSSFPSEFFPGVINPIKKRTIKKHLNIDTRFRDNYYATSSTNFNLNLPLKMDNVLQMQLNAFELPTSYYVVSKQYGNNFFTITVDADTTVINIQNGNYTQATIMDYINTQLTSAGAPFSYVSFTVNLVNYKTGSAQTVVGPNETGPGPVTNIELNFQKDRNGIPDNNTSLPLKFGWMLGFRNGVYTDNLNYVSEGIVDISGPKYFYLVIDDYNNNVSNNFYSAFNSSVLNKNILARISLQVQTFNILEQNNLNIITPPREYFGPVNLQTMNIQLLDEYGRIVNLNNMDYSFCLSLITVYDL
jgi:hypothetical protein